MRSRTPLKVPRFLAPVAKQLRAVERSVEKCLILETPEVKTELQPNGRVQLKFRKGSVVGAPPSAVIPEAFVLFLCLDETGSIGIGGATRAIEIIDAYSSRCQGIGFVSFGDIMCETFAITDPATCRARLQTVVDSGGSHPIFFQDGGGDTSENGVDALNVALEQHAAYSSPLPRLTFMKTDNDNYLHNTSDPAVVLTGLQGLWATWLEFNGDQEAAPHYSDSFPENPTPPGAITYGEFPLPTARISYRYRRAAQA